VDASIGVAIFPGDGTDRPTLLRRADVAMYSAKAKHSGFAFAVSGQQDEQARQRLTTLEEFRTGLARNELRLHYQPQTDLVTGRVVGVEALVRWDHPVRGLVYPDHILPIAEKAGLMSQVTEQILDIGLAQVAVWRRSGLDITVAVNLAMANMQDVTFPSRVVDALRRHQLPAEALHLEITESMLMNDATTANELLTMLHGLGIKLAVDDYGTGYSSLAYLHELPVDDLKLDRAFVGHSDTDPRSAAIVENTVKLAHSLGMRMIAEGVETEAVMRLLTDYGCDVAQGYFIARPQSPDSLTPWLHQQAAVESRGSTADTSRC
jgi:EAL domain-containing protein (putative c-di-GMP-specific phosphodiesterase class I)